MQTVIPGQSMAKTSLAHRSSCFSLAILKLCTLQPTRDQTNLSSMTYNELQILGQGEEMLCAHHVRRHVILGEVITPVVTPLPCYQVSEAVETKPVIGDFTQ